METIFDLSFNENYNNKLNCKFFTTIRLSNHAKFNKGNTLKIHCKGIYIFNAKVHEVQEIFLHQLKDFICYLDIGQDAKNTIDILKKMFPKYDFETKKIMVVLMVQ